MTSVTLRLEVLNGDQLLFQLRSPAGAFVRRLPFSFDVSVQQQERMRWYFEDYLVSALGPEGSAESARELARLTKSEMVEVGQGLYGAVFGHPGARIFEETLLSDPSDARIEIATGDRSARSIPWELMRRSPEAAPLVLDARSFVRRPASRPEKLARSLTGGGPVRVLLVIARPMGCLDVPFRSVAGAIMAIAQEVPSILDVEVLRPARIERLESTLIDASRDGFPYDIVHFDGHGGLDSSTGEGYVLFESSSNVWAHDRAKAVSGSQLGDALVSAGVPLLVVNACRSAYVHTDVSHNAREEAGTQVLSVADRVIERGVHAVVAMRYNVYVDTAALITRQLYRALASGLPVGDAVTEARASLSQNTTGPIADPGWTGDGWAVPIVYEASALSRPLLSEADAVYDLAESAQVNHQATRSLPPEPIGGFIGRDEAVLALDRAFDDHTIVLLRGFIGNGKSATALEFARWYSATGGHRGEVIYTPIHQGETLDYVLRRAISALSSRPRTMVVDDRVSDAAAILAKNRALWIVDNLDEVGETPGFVSHWSTCERAAFIEVVQRVTSHGCRVLLISRNNQNKWLAPIASIVPLPNMPIAERWRVVRALAGEANAASGANATVWSRLIGVSQGNPLTLVTAAIAMAETQGVGGTGDLIVDDLVRMDALEDDSDNDNAAWAEPLIRALAPALAKLSASDRGLLGLASLFAHYVQVLAFAFMGNNVPEWRLDSLSGIDVEEVEACFDRAVDVGVLTRLARGIYAVHPALRYVMRAHYGEDYRSKRAGATSEDVERAYAEAVVSTAYFHAFQARMSGMEIDWSHIVQSLIESWKLATERSWWRLAVRAMTTAQEVYRDTGRWLEWKAMVEPFAEKFSAAYKSHRDRELDTEWLQVQDALSSLHEAEGRLSEAASLQLDSLRLRRRRLKEAKKRNANVDGAASSLAVGLNNLGMIEVRRRRYWQARRAFIESIRLADNAGDWRLACLGRLNMGGHVLMSSSGTRDLVEAGAVLLRGLETARAHDDAELARGFLVELGTVKYESYIDRRDDVNRGELVGLLYEARTSYEEALRLTRTAMPGRAAVALGQLGFVYGEMGRVEQYRGYFERAMRAFEASGDLEEANKTHLDLAGYLHRDGYIAEARIHAQTAIRRSDDDSLKARARWFLSHDV